MNLLVACLAALAIGPTPPAPTAPPPPAGARFALTDGPLFVPAGYRPPSAGATLLVHLHGGTSAERALVRAEKSALVVSVAIPGLSRVYAQRFQSPRALDRILDEVTAHLAILFPDQPPRIARLIVSSFSAGFGGVREMLEQPEHFARIDTLVLADTLYAGYAGDPAQKQVEPKHLAGFLRFAREAQAGRKRFLLSHCDLQPEGYASTRETADVLIAQLGGRRQPCHDPWPVEGMTLTSRFQAGQCEILGFAGTTGADHMKHLAGLWALLKRLP